MPGHAPVRGWRSWHGPEGERVRTWLSSGLHDPRRPRRKPAFAPPPLASSVPCARKSRDARSLRRSAVAVRASSPPDRAARAARHGLRAARARAGPCRGSSSARRTGARILERLEFVRRFFPELADGTVRVGLAQKRGVLGWGSLDPERPGHLGAAAAALLLHHRARVHAPAAGPRLVPRGERACDLWALARSPLLNDAPPELPAAAARRCAAAAGSIPSRRTVRCARRRAAPSPRASRGDRRYLLRFERELREALADGRRRG